MKKFIITLLLGIFAAVGTSAQSIYDNPYNRVYIGVRAGLDISCPGNIKNGAFSVDLLNPGAGFDIGAVINVPLWKNLYFEPGLMLNYSTMGYDISVMNDDAELVDASMSNRQLSFRVPFRAGYRFDFEPVSVSVFTGPELKIGVYGRDHLSVPGVGSESDGCYNTLNRVNLLWQFGAGVSRGHWVFELSGGVGMLDMYKGPASMHQGNVSLTVGYNF